MTTTPEEPREQDKAGSSTTEGLMRPDMRDVDEPDGPEADEAAATDVNTDEPAG